MASEGGSGSGRAAGDENALFKILEDDSVVPLLDDNQGMPKVRFLIHSPVEGKKDLYISFQSGWRIDEETIGLFIHVKEDGSIVPISSSIIYSQNNPVSFDQNGNLYFMASESGANVIYMYDPVTCTKEQLTAAVNNTSYSQIELAADGTYIIARGGNSSASFIRLIPTANPDMAQNIFYNSSTSTNAVPEFAYNPRNKEMYVSGDNISDKSLSGFHKTTIGNIYINDWQWVALFNGYAPSPSFFDYINYYNDQSRPSFSWPDEYRDPQGNPDYSKIMEALYVYFRSDVIEFRHPTDSSLINESALAELTDDLFENYYIHTPTSGRLFVPGEFFLDNCYHSGTNTNVRDYNTGGLGFRGIKTIIIASDDSVWGIDSGKNVGQLINSIGQRDCYVPQSLEGRVGVSLKPSASHMYFRADVTTGTQETGYHNIYRFSYSDPETVQNLFDGIASRNTKTMEVFTFDVSGDYLYFGGTQGVSLLTGKIYIPTLRYTELDFGQKVTALVMY